MCDGCRQIYFERTPPGEPPCDTCREVPLEENKDAIKIFFLVRDQLIMGINGPVDINHQAIHGALRLYKIERKRECFEKILVLSKWWLKKMDSKGGPQEEWGES